MFPNWLGVTLSRGFARTHCSGWKVLWSSRHPSSPSTPSCGCSRSLRPSLSLVTFTPWTSPKRREKWAKPCYVQNYNLYLLGEETAPGGEEEGVGCDPGRLEPGLWHWGEGLWKIAESALVCFNNLVIKRYFVSRFYLTPSEGYKQGHTSGAARQHCYHWSQKEVTLEICSGQIFYVNCAIMYILVLPSIFCFPPCVSYGFNLKLDSSFLRHEMLHRGKYIMCPSKFSIRLQIMCPSREVRLPPLPTIYFHQMVCTQTFSLSKKAIIAQY